MKRAFSAATTFRALAATLALSALLALPGCPGRDGGGGIGREEYIATYVEILSTAALAGDSLSARDSTRAILERRGVSERALLEFASRHADDPDYLDKVWGEIEARLRERGEGE